MKILIACEESQRICTAFRERGHEAYSCDILEPSGGHPEWHIKGDVLPILSPYNIDPATDTMGIMFKTMDGAIHTVPRWDLIIAHPPCTYLTISGNRWFNEERYGDKARERKKLREEAIEFFMKFINADCDHIAVENPIGVMSTTYKKPTQIIQPYQFGEPERKSTCLWLKGLPKLTPTNIVDPEIIKYQNGKGTDSPWHMKTIALSKEERSRARSKTYIGIARAIADQWGAIL